MNQQISQHLSQYSPPVTFLLRQLATFWPEKDNHCLSVDPEPENVEQEQFGKILERVQKGPLVYRPSDNLPFGQKWNTAGNSIAGPSVGRWAAELPGVKLATTIEFPYANVLGNEVNAGTARAFGHDLARAIRDYLGATAK